MVQLPFFVILFATLCIEMGKQVLSFLQNPRNLMVGKQMSKNYVKVYQKYKQQAFNRISVVLMGILREIDFFKRYPQT